MAGYGIQLKTVDDCKICQSEHRDEIETTYAKATLGELLDDGTKPTKAWMEANAEKLWGWKIRRSSLWKHCTAHFQQGDPAELTQAVKDLPTMLNEMMASGGVPVIAPEQYLELVIAIGYQKLLKEPASVTTDQVMKAISELTKRRHSEVQDAMLKELTQAIGSSARRVGPPIAPVIEATIVQEITDGDEG